MITVDRLYVRYDDTNILEDINLNLPTGITCAVIGPSGCGKSTLLNVLAGLQKNYQGLVQINGENPSPKKQTIGFIPQNYGLLPWLTVKENILLGLKIKKALLGVGYQPRLRKYILNRNNSDYCMKELDSVLRKNQKER